MLTAPRDHTAIGAAPGIVRTVVYAVNEPASAAHRSHLLDQLRRSLESLRAHNRSVPVRIFAFGEMMADQEPLARSLDVEIVSKGSYAAALARRCPAPHAEVLARYPVLHKWLALADLAQGRDDQVLYVDNDTYFFDDVATIFDRCRTHDFYAREEPFSSRSHAGYRPTYIDEPALFALAEAEGCRPLPTYNLGAVLLNHATCVRFAGVISDFLDFVFRLCLGIVRDVDPKDYVGETELEHLRENLARLGDDRRALRYPSSNYWIVEQIGLLLALGRIEGLTHDVFTAREIIQGVEFHTWPSGEPLPVMAHYYTSNTRAFYAWCDARKATSR